MLVFITLFILAADVFDVFRDKWLFKPVRRPEGMQGLPEVAKPSELDPNPFEWSPQEPSSFEFEMVEGIMRVYDGPERKQELFPVPGNSYDFFSDMHWCARAPCLFHTSYRLKLEPVGASRTLLWRFHRWRQCAKGWCDSFSRQCAVVSPHSMLSQPRTNILLQCMLLTYVEH